MSAVRFRCALPSRAVLRIAGADAHEFLQGMFTNDLRTLRPGGSMWGCFLNVPGRVISDACLYQEHQLDAGDPAILIEVQRSIADDLLEHLLEMKMRKKIRIANLRDERRVVADCQWGGVEAEMPVGPPAPGDAPAPFFADPRGHALLPARLQKRIVPVGDVVEGEATVGPAVHVAPPDLYDALLYSCGVGEGTRVFPSEQALPFEGNLDFLRGVSFHKGCYLGQELTHRTHVTLVTRKRVVPVVLGDEAGGRRFGDYAAQQLAPVHAEPSDPMALWNRVAADVEASHAAASSPAKRRGSPGVDVVMRPTEAGAAGVKVGQLVASSGPFGLALLRLRMFDPVTQTARLALADGTPVAAHIPAWWDRRALKKLFAEA